MIATFILQLSFALAVAPVMMQQARSESGWAPFSFLLGEWVGEGGGGPGQGTGAFWFHVELEGKILVRRNRTDFPATKDRPASTHEDLMVVYKDPAGGGLRAVYFDNEGHVIHYAVGLLEDPSSVQFVSDAAPSAPRFRLTYRKTGSDTVRVTFAIAPAGKPESFSVYLEGSARRKAGR